MSTATPTSCTEVGPKTSDVWTCTGAACGSLLLSVAVVHDLHWETHISIVRGTALFLLGLVFFTCSYYAIKIAFEATKSGRRVAKTYNLQEADIMEISNKQVSAVQALFCCMTGATCSWYSCRRNMMKTSHYISEAYAWFGAAYFFYDIWSMYKVHRAKVAQKPEMNGNGNAVVKTESLVSKITSYLRKNGVIVFHHLFIGMFGFLVITHLRGGFGDCFFGFVYLMEASTPFVSVRGILSKIGLKDSSLYVYNGIIMLITFFICRVAMFPYVIYVYGQAAGLDFISAIKSLPRGCLTGIAILLLPQIYWFWLMIRGAVKIMITPASPKAKTN
ncbi:TLC domain-containing protein 3A [Aethina tumida]|uniref:TLC domain-containing protein 3A n=1 Tax=Aethina tumida TaxID=116153 RepID=UPI0021489B1B|nr:TLC domain-containing protein 3A [Aethina tumida]